MKRKLLLSIIALSGSILFSQTNHFVEVSNFKFTPQQLTITLGDTVTWKWIDGNHTTTSDSTSGQNAWNSVINSTNLQFSIVIKSPGLHTYYCVPHKSMGMTGSIQVDNIVPVELTSFRAQIDENKILLSWETATELNNMGFDVERRIDKGEWTKIGYEKGNGTSSIKHHYKYEDNNILQDGKYYYRLRQQDFNGKYQYFRSNAVNFKKELSFELQQNYPNPFNPETSIRLVLPVSGFVTLKVYNLLGQQISELFSGHLESGLHSFQFSAQEYISGIYLYKAEALGEDGSKFISTRKMTLLK